MNDAAVKIMRDAILKKIIHDLAGAIRKNITIDWNLKESMRAHMRTIIRRLLKKYGYPPDQQPAAIKTVMGQAELLWGGGSYMVNEKVTYSRMGLPMAKTIF